MVLFTKIINLDKKQKICHNYKYINQIIYLCQIHQNYQKDKINKGGGLENLANLTIARLVNLSEPFGGILMDPKISEDLKPLFNLARKNSGKNFNVDAQASDQLRISKHYLQSCVSGYNSEGENIKKWFQARIIFLKIILHQKLTEEELSWFPIEK